MHNAALKEIDLLNRCKKWQKSWIASHSLAMTGFTLAEVLITLVVLGIIAAVTIPTMRNSLDDKKYIIPLKKAHSVLSEAFDLHMNNSVFSSAYAYSRPDYFIGNVIKNLKVQKICCNVEGVTLDLLNLRNIASSCFIEAAPSSSECFPTIYDYRHVPNVSKFWSDNKKYRFGSFELSDGTSVLILDILVGVDYSIDSLQNILGVSFSNKELIGGMMCNPNKTDSCENMDVPVLYIVFVDVNGKKGPNQPGQDVHSFVYTKSNGLIPTGADNSVLGLYSDCKVNWNCTYDFLYKEELGR